MKKIDKLSVIYNNRLVGTLKLVDDIMLFQYSSSWLENGFSLNPLSLPLTRDIFIPQKSTLDGMFGVFFDSLPDGYGILVTIRMLKSKNINFDSLNQLEKLALLSENSLGGLEYVPSYIQVKEKALDYDLDMLSEEARKILESKNSIIDIDSLYLYGGSSGGARPKVHLKINDDFWIIKFKTHNEVWNIGEYEYKINLLARECGIDIPEIKLFPSKVCPGYFGVKRFDRKNGKRVHMISLSSILETSHRIPNLDYVHLFQVILKVSVNPKRDLYEAYKRMVFNILIKNRDDHGKNFSFIYNDDEKGYRLSPAYDLTSLPNKYEHEMTVLGNGNPTLEDVLELGLKFDLDKEKCLNINQNIKKLVADFKI